MSDASSGASRPSSAADRMDFELHQHQRRQIWAKRAPWDKIYRDAYEFAIPHRGQAGRGRPRTRSIASSI